MASFSMKVGGSDMPDGVTSVSRSDELLWSEGTGRSATSGNMAGSVVAKKQTYSVSWGMLTAAQYAAVRSAIGAGFMPLKIEAGGAVLADCTVYRGNITGEMAGVFGGTAYYRNVNVELVEK